MGALVAFFGLSTARELRLAFWAICAIGVAGLALYIHHAGYQECRAPQIAAEKQQKAEDTNTNQETIDALKAENQRLRDLAAKPAPPVWLCLKNSVPTGSAAAGTQPFMVSPLGESAGGVSAGTVRIDIGPSLSDLKIAGAAISDYRDRTYEWAVKQAEGAPK